MCFIGRFRGILCSSISVFKHKGHQLYGYCFLLRFLTYVVINIKHYKNLPNNDAQLKLGKMPQLKNA